MSGAGFPLSPWHGHFRYEYPRDPIEYPMHAHLAFVNGRIHGHGQDEDGAFQVEGLYDLATGRTSWRKVYPRNNRAVIVAFAGMWDPKINAMEGRWRVVNKAAYGKFALRPGDGSMMAMSMAARMYSAMGPVESTLARDAVVFDGERDMLALLEKEPLFNEARMNAARAASSSSREHRSLLLSGLRLTPRLHPLVFNVVEHCIRRLGVTAPYEAFCFADADMQAFVVRDTGKILLGFSSALLERLDEGELTFVVGHELGHAIFGHVALRAETLREDERVSPSTVLRWFAYKRYAEITADRVGLLCCDQLATAVRALFKVTSGLSNTRNVHDTEEFSSQLRDLRELGDRSKGKDAGGWLSTHPYSPLRLEALRLFARSQTFHQLQGRSGGDLTEQQLEREVSAIVGIMNPSAMFDGPANREANLFLGMAAIEIAFADGVIDPRESRMLLDVRAKMPTTGDAEMIGAMTPEERQVVMAEVSEKLLESLPRVKLARMIEDLCAIAAVDGRVDRREVEVLMGAAELLDVDPELVIRTLERASAPLD